MDVLLNDDSFIAKSSLYTDFFNSFIFKTTNENNPYTSKR